MANKYQFLPHNRPGACFGLVEGAPLVRVGDKFECAAGDPILARLNALYLGVKPRGGERADCCVLVSEGAPAPQPEPAVELSAGERINALVSAHGGGAALSGVASALDLSTNGAKAAVAARIIAWMGDDDAKGAQVLAILSE